jgi:hypothetical protein
MRLRIGGIGKYMKVFCKVDGIHFPQDFERTLKPPCNYWGDMGMGNLQEDLKKKFWDWLFSMPSDEIGLKSKIGIAVDFKTVALENGDWFANTIPGYNEMSEEEQQDAQRNGLRNILRDNQPSRSLRILQNQKIEV